MIFIIVVLILVIFIIGDGEPILTGGEPQVNKNIVGSPDKKVSEALRIFIISNKINDIMKIPDMTRNWITSYFYSYINYLALYEPKTYTNSYSYFPYNIPANTDAIKKVLELIKYDVILNQASDMFNLKDKIDRMVLTINSYKVINYNIEWYNEHLKINTDSMNITIPKSLYDKYKIGKATESDIISMLLKYSSNNPYVPGKPLRISGSLLSVDPLIYKKLDDMFSHKSIECFASPLNHTMDYLAVFEGTRNVFPGCLGHLDGEFIKKKHKSLFLVNPPFDIISVKFAYSLTKDLRDSTMLITLPAKDVGTFSYAFGRKGSGKDNDWESIKNFMKLPTFKGILLLPSLFMYYIYLDSGKRKNITFDTIMIILSNDNDKDDNFFLNMKNMIYDTVGKNMLPTTLRKKNLREIDTEKIKGQFSGELAKKIIDDMKLSKDKVFQHIPGVTEAKA